MKNGKAKNNGYMPSFVVSNSKGSITMDNQIPPSHHKPPMQTFTCKVKPLSFEEKEELRLRILYGMGFGLKNEN